MPVMKTTDFGAQNQLIDICMINYPLFKFKDLDSQNLEFTSFLYENYMDGYAARFDQVMAIASEKWGNNPYFAPFIQYTRDYNNNFLTYSLNFPSFIFWINGMEDLLLDYRGGQDPDQNFTRRCLSELGILAAGQPDFFFRQLEKFLISHALYSGCNKKLPSGIEIAEGWYPGNKYFFIDHHYSGKDQEEGVFEPYAQQVMSSSIAPFFIMPDDKRNYQVHNFDIFFNFKAIERWERVGDPARLEVSAKRIRESLNLIETVMPGFNAQFGLMIRQFVPLDTNGFIETQSGTFSGLFGVVFLTTPDNPYWIAEMIIHEFNHHKLFLLEEVCPLFKTENYECIHYSPLRDELRSQQGVYHALFVLSEIVKFWSKAYAFIPDRGFKELVYRRVWTIIHQIKAGSADLLYTSEMSAVGRGVMEAISEEIALLESEFFALSPETRPFFTEIKEEMSVWERPIIEAIQFHRRQMWNTASPECRKPINI